MEVIPSFTIDHTQLKPGIYVSREDKGFTTFDLRITEPNKEPAVAPAAIHSLEHLMATWFRNSEVKEDVVYVGPMGCLTGMYIIMMGTYSVEDMRRLTIKCLQWILTQDKVPATSVSSGFLHRTRCLPLSHKLAATICFTTCRCASGKALAISTVYRTIFTASTRSYRLRSETVKSLLMHNRIIPRHLLVCLLSLVVVEDYLAHTH